MFKNLLIVIVGLAVVGALYAFVVPALPVKVEPVACTQEAMICPDGSAVGRTGPNCEFAACPTVSTSTATVTGTVVGTALVGPTCPVMRNPPDPACADKPYVGGFELSNSVVSKMVYTNDSGSFTAQVAPGTYSLVSTRQTTLPRCTNVENIVVVADVVTKVSISCDSGIR